MIDPRWYQVADVLVNYSTKVKAGEKVLITMMEVDTLPLALAVYTEAVKAGAQVHIEFQSVLVDRALLSHGTLEQAELVPEMHAKGMRWADVYIGLRGSSNPYELEGIPPDKITARKKAMGLISSMRIDQTRWVLSRIPNHSLAQQAKMSTEEMMTFYFNATVKDWEQESRDYYELKEVFQAGENVRVVGKETEIRFSTKGRLYRVGAGLRNMPDGEIFTAPVDDSLEGKIFFEFPGVYAGKFIKDICLEFKKGEIVTATASENEDLLKSIIALEGANRVGEFGVGTNFGIDRFIGDILFDEKIGGTIHLALGWAYSDCNGINKSPIHWDIVKDLREEGEIYLDEKLVFKSGKFLV
ncbi:MAG: aminopeptidase [Chloroflexi bacterium]|jgi:aminopeptidase|nr:aminopeptidase [Chloroflexota bacterium]